ncbi:unnamed protein product [Rotaria sordida]|uniref:Uncharacterized protein n=1 Tax=Rotaria sordida TaxID=392033 RepID=A0A819IGR4_9BILA|nr:unnamed protein product [Rotaria sordida]
MDDVRSLFKYLTQSLPIMSKQGPMSGQCIPETNQMENFLKSNFGFHNIDGQYIVSGVRAFELLKPISRLDPNKKIYFPHDQYHSPFIMTIAEILKWQNSYVVYADGNIQGMDKEFLCHALQGRSKNGSEAFRMKEGVEIVVETGIGLGVFAGKHLGIDGQIRKLSAFAIRQVLQKEGATFQNIRAVVFALPVFAKDRNGRQLPDTYDDFVHEFTKSNYSGPIPVLIADQDMHELTVAIALRGFRVSQLNPADSHGVFGEYWQNHGPAVEEKLALTTLGLLVQHHLINDNVLDRNRYKII